MIRVEPALAGPLFGDKAESAIFDNSKIKAFVPGFRAGIPLREGLARTLRWFEEKPERMRVVDATNAMMDRVIARY